MDNETLRAIQLVQLEIAKEIKRVCEERGISYWLESGTLLGAVRHQGFIPWDDDLDIGMLRADYERFLLEAPNILSNKFFLQTWETDPNYGMPFAKIRKNDTVYLEEGTENVKMHHGVYVDIFPFDVFPTDERVQKKFSREFYLLRRISMVKRGYQPWKTETNHIRRIVKLFAYSGTRIISLFTTRSRIQSKWSKMSTKYNLDSYPYLYPQGGAADFGQVIIPRVYLEGRKIELPFEDDSFSAPDLYEDYLTDLYGDYMTPPPEDKRYNRHHICEVKL